MLPLFFYSEDGFTDCLQVYTAFEKKAMTFLFLTSQSKITDFNNFW